MSEIIPNFIVVASQPAQEVDDGSVGPAIDMLAAPITVLTVVPTIVVV
jgi:hypothetical protein